MKLELGFPKELEDAKKRKVPLVIPVGTIEYHGPHCALGCDTQIATGLIDRLAEEKELVIAPPIWYGVASYAVAGPEKNTVTVDIDVFEQYVYCILKSLLYGGWKNIYLLIHHQYEQENLLPMTLACMKAGKKLVFEYLEETRGRGWWGDNNNAAFYAELEASDNPWSWITVLPCMSTAAQNATGYDHAGKWESSILSALCPEAVKKERVKESDAWFIQSAAESSPAIGMKMVDVSLESLKERIV
ncbi:MAG: creatininase family protein [Clostridiaceae bacterium]|nr:creatininase family protein [Clostridiaceae bacterium]